VGSLDPMTEPFCGEIFYCDEAEGNVHSDICKHDDSDVSDEYRAHLHATLDEWLDKAMGSGAFWVGNPEYFLSWERNENK